ncbi:hypothetical protein [Kitasatospora sp. MBT63]|uniref:hypothetical protein n=1 Tax=Kitasatospora sp. MBT63 TaxID=1444768 RepID=UPI000539FB0D|nr:hypothetical protein [Kitasatospora sp. MBT63]
MADDLKNVMSDLICALGDNICDLHYRTAHDAAEIICSGVYEMIPVELHDLVHEAIMAGYSGALSDLEEGKLDDQVRKRSGLLE